MLILILVPTVTGIDIRGVEAFKTKPLQNQVLNGVSPEVLSARLWENYLGIGYFDVSIRVDIGGDTTITVVEGRQYLLADLAIMGVADSISRQALLRPGRKPSATTEGIRKLMESIVLQFAESGYPFASVVADSLVLGPVRQMLFVTANPGPQVDVATVSFEGLRVTRPSTLEAYLVVSPGRPYVESEIQRSYENLRKLDFVRTSEAPEVIFRPAERDVALIFPLREERNFAFDGLGYLTPDNLLAGSISAALRNIFGYGERISFEWQKANRVSSRLRLKGMLPRILGTPLDAGIELKQRDRDSSFVSASVEIVLSYHLASNWNFSTGMAWSKITPEPERISSAARALAVNLITTYDNRVEKRKPRSGVVVEYSFQSAYRREFLPGDGVVAGYSRRLAGDFTLYQSLTHNIVWKQRLSAFQAASDFVPVSLDELTEIGGPESVRGFRDNSFFAELGGISSSELLWLALDNLTLSIFSDNAVFRTEVSDSGISGFGAGLRVDTSLGEFRFEAALGEKKTLGQLLVHFGFTGEL